MDLALAEARTAGARGGAHRRGGGAGRAGGGRGRNARERLQDPTAHAEVLGAAGGGAAPGEVEAHRRDGLRDARAMSDVRGRAGQREGGAAGVRHRGPKAGATGTLFDIARDPRLNHRLEVTRGVRARSAQSC